VKTTAASGAYSAAQLTTYTVIQGTWVGIGAKHDIDGNWKIYTNEGQTLSATISDTYTTTYYGQMTAILFGDIT
jgi:hypothetical protein